MFDAPPFSLRLIDDATTQHTKALQTKAILAEAFLRAPPSGKIRFAIEDLEAVERSQRYEIDMETWHSPNSWKNVCLVCFAGAVMANRHGIQPHQTYVGPFQADGPNEYSANDRWDDLFSALDEFRTGYVEAFLTIDGTVAKDKIVAFAMTQSPDDPFGCFPGHVNYEDDPAGFKVWARGMADRLEAIGH